MRIGFLRSRYSSENNGGAERSLKLLLTGFQKLNHEIHVFVSSWDNSQPAGINLHLVSTKGRGWANLKSYAAGVIPVVNSLKLDICLSLDRVPGVPIFRAGDGCHAAWLARRAPYESLLKRISFRFNPLHRIHLELEEKLLNSPSLIKVIANSRLVADELKLYYGLSEDKLKIIYNGVDEQQLKATYSIEARQIVQRELGIKFGEPVLLFLGSGFERKGLAFALAALAKLPKTKLLVAGRGNITFYQRLASRLGVINQVFFLGQRSDVPRLLAAASLLILPTIYDPCSNSCLEALFVGMPVVTTLANGAAEFIKNDINGVLVSEPADSTVLANACNRALLITRPVPNLVSTQIQWIRNIESELLQIVTGEIL